MKITESHLRRIVREEMHRLNEMDPTFSNAIAQVDLEGINALMLSVPLLAAAAAAAGMALPIFTQKLSDLKNRLMGTEKLPDNY